MSLGERAIPRLLNKAFGWKYISVVHDGQVKTYRVHKTNLYSNYAFINGRRYIVHEDGWLRQWIGGEPWKPYEFIV